MHSRKTSIVKISKASVVVLFPRASRSNSPSPSPLNAGHAGYVLIFSYTLTGGTH